MNRRTFIAMLALSLALASPPAASRAKDGNDDNSGHGGGDSDDNSGHGNADDDGEDVDNSGQGGGDDNSGKGGDDNSEGGDDDNSGPGNGDDDGGVGEDGNDDGESGGNGGGGEDGASGSLDPADALPLQDMLRIFARYGDLTVVDIGLVQRRGELQYKFRFVDAEGRVRDAYFDARTGDQAP